MFVRGVTREAFVAFVKWCNAELYPAAIRECGCIENHIQIDYQKEFERLVMVSAKKYVAVFRHYKGIATCTCDTQKGEPGAIDVYAMTCRDCGKKWEALPPPRGKPEIRGLEYKRGDAALLARRLQWNVIQKLMAELCEDPEAFVPMIERVRDHVLLEPLPLAEVQLSKSLSKPLKEYAVKIKTDGTAAAQPPHVQVARLLKERGELVGEGTRIPYVVMDASVSPMKVAPAADYQGECDRFHVLGRPGVAASARLLAAAFPGVDWKERFGKVRPRKVRATPQAPAGPGNPGFQAAQALGRARAGGPFRRRHVNGGDAGRDEDRGAPGPGDRDLACPGSRLEGRGRGG